MIVRRQRPVKPPPAGNNNAAASGGRVEVISNLKSEIVGRALAPDIPHPPTAGSVVSTVGHSQPKNPPVTSP